MGSELFIVDDSDEDWKAASHLRDQWPAAFQTTANA